MAVICFLLKQSFCHSTGNRNEYSILNPKKRKEKRTDGISGVDDKG